MPKTRTSRTPTRQPRRGKPPRFTAAEFFAGIGLVRLALEKTGDWKVVYANDIDPGKQKMYVDSFGDEHFPVSIA